MRKLRAALTAAMILMPGVVASNVYAQTNIPSINSADSVTNSPQQTISGTYLPQIFAGKYSFVRILDTAGGAVYSLGDLNPDKSGHWSVDVTLGGMTLAPKPGEGFVPGVEGVHSIVAAAIDPSGNILGRSAPVLYTLVRIPPVLTFSPVAAETNNPTISVSGTINVVALRLPISIFDNGRSLKQVSAASNGRWSASITLSGDGAHSLSAAATDVAGNRGESPTVVTVLNTTRPTLAITGAGLTAPGVFLLSGTIDVIDISRPVEIFDGARHIATVLTENVTNDGAWIVSVVLGPGAHSLTARAKNAAGTGISASVSMQGAGTP